MEKLADIASWPLPALIAFGVTFGIVSALVKAGIAAGRTISPAANAAGAQVAAVIVDPTALNRLSDEVSKLVDAVGSLIEIGEKMARSEDHMAIELDRIREELRIQREVERRRS